MLLRMAEITKLEEHIKCTRRSDSVKEEKMGLLTYNLASAESQIALDNIDAGQKRQVCRQYPKSIITPEDELQHHHPRP
jgi:microcompartment protein CcmK/EutM